MDLYDADGSLNRLAAQFAERAPANPPVAALRPNPADWSSADLARQLGYYALHGIDWAQTRTIAKSPGEYHETNRMLGEHPSVGRVNNYFLATAVGHAILADLLSPQLRPYFQYGTAGLEAAVAGRNKFKFGIGTTF